MLCEIARNIQGDRLETVKTLEHDLGLMLVAFSCRSLEPAREAKLQKLMEEFGAQLQAEPAEPDDEQLGRIRAAEQELGVSLVAVRA